MPSLKGRLPDLAAILVGVIIAKVLTTFVAEDLVVFVANTFGTDVYEKEGVAAYLWLDVALTFAFEFGALWLTWYLSRSGRFTVPLIAGGAILLITMFWRWGVKDYGWPGWYEITLLLTVPIALCVLRWLSANRGHVAA